MKTTHFFGNLSISLAFACVGCEKRQELSDEERQPSPAANQRVAAAQESVDKPTPPKFEDPSDGYFSAYLLIREAEKTGNREESHRKYQEALSYFRALKDTFPDWKTAMVDHRIELTTRCLSELEKAVR